MKTVKVFFANLGKTYDVEVNAVTLKSLNMLHKDGTDGVFTCSRNQDDDVLMPYRVQPAKIEP